MEWEQMLGKGIYTVPEAARLTGVSAGRIHRWIKGQGPETKTPRPAPVLSQEIPDVEGTKALSFRDLMEVRFIDAFLKHGVTWPALRSAAAVAAEILESTHPFSTKKFKTDGRTIFVEIAEKSGDPSLLDLVRRQYNIHAVVDPKLYEGLVFGVEGRAERWHPLWPDKKVVVDPEISFGQPSISRGGIPTYVLAGAVGAEGSLARVAQLYGVPTASVRAAVEYEDRQAA